MEKWASEKVKGIEGVKGHPWIQESGPKQGKGETPKAQRPQQKRVKNQNLPQNPGEVFLVPTHHQKKSKHLYKYLLLAKPEHGRKDKS